MATQKNLKSKATASKSRTSKSASVKKAPKAISKTKVTAAKLKPAAKPQNAKGKKTVSSSKPKPVAKSAPKKTISKAAVSKKPAAAPASKGKSVARPATVKPAPSKAKATPVAKSSPVVSAKKATPVASSRTNGKKPAAPAKSAQAQKTAPVAKPVVSNKTTEVKKPQPTTAPAPVTAKSTQAETTKKSVGSKSSDRATKPSVSTHEVAEKSKDLNEGSTHIKPSKPINVPGKSIEKMSDKKEHKPVAAATIAEEPQKTRYNDKELEEFDQLIDQKLIVAREQLEFYLKQLEDMAENPDNKIKGLDDGLSSLESERVSSMAARQQKLIQHLENAKIRIKNKVYGICRETGKLISKERLRAVPHATLSIEAKQAQN